jgi:hypothetical protein
VRIEHGFFKEENAARAGASTEEMLRTLVDEVPTQVGKADDIVGLAGWRLSHMQQASKKHAAASD